MASRHFGSKAVVMGLALALGQLVCGSAAADTTAERIAPVGQVNTGAPIAAQNQAAPAAAAAAAPAAASAPAAARTGEEVFNGACMACHGLGIAGAPKMGDKEAWAPRIAQGEDVLVQHATNGFQGKSGVMPPRGTCAACSDAELKNAIEFMVSKSK